MNNVTRLFLTSLFLISLNHLNLKAMWGDTANEVVGAKLSGVGVCSKAIEDLDAIIAYRNFDQYLLTPDNPGNSEPDFEAYDIKKYYDLRCFYSDSPTEREPAHIRMRQNFLKIIKSFSSLSHTHPEFEVLFFFADDSVRFMNTHFQEQFQIIFQDDELSHLKNLIHRLQAVSQAIDNNGSRDQIKELENQVTQAFDFIPIIMGLAQHFYLPAVAKKHADMLGDYDHTTFAGRAALTRALICYGELLKTIPDKKTSTVAKACITFRDKAVKVLPRRLDALTGDKMVTSYSSMNDFLRDLRAYIFTPDANAPAPERIITLLDSWGYKPNGKSTGTDSTDEEVPSNLLLLSILQQMRTISGLTVRLPDIAFFDEACSVWSNFECSAENYLSTADSKAIETLSLVEQSAKEADLKKIRKQRMEDLKRKPLKEWPAILKGHDFTKAAQVSAAITEINGWLGNVQKELHEGSPLLADDSYVAAMTKARLMMTRPFHVRLRLLNHHMQQNSRFDKFVKCISAYDIVS